MPPRKSSKRGKGGGRKKPPAKTEKVEVKKETKIKSNKMDDTEEVWDLVEVIPESSEPRVCRSSTCSARAVAIWVTNKAPDDLWPTCEKCQLEEFGGWPEGVDLPSSQEDHVVEEEQQQQQKQQQASDKFATETSCIDKEADKKIGETFEKKADSEQKEEPENPIATVSSGNMDDKLNDIKVDPSTDLGKDANLHSTPTSDNCDETSATTTFIPGDSSDGNPTTKPTPTDASETNNKVTQDADEEPSDTENNEELPSHIDVVTQPAPTQDEVIKEGLPTTNTEGDNNSNHDTENGSEPKESADNTCPAEEVEQTVHSHSANIEDKAENETDDGDVEEDDGTGVPGEGDSDVNGGKELDVEENGDADDAAAKTEEEQDGEVWDLTEVLSLAELTKDGPIKCGTDDCVLAACCVWISNLDPKTKWYSCLDCQEADFDGWPPVDELPIKSMSLDHQKAIAKYCSRKRKPKMPDVPEEIDDKIISPSSAKTSPAKTIEAKFSTNLVTPLADSKKLPNKESSSDKQPATPQPKAPKKPSAGALAIHKKWQQAAEAMGGAGSRIVVSKPAAKKLIYDMLYDAFCPMNITQIYKKLKAIVPSPVLSTCLQDMSLDKNETGNPFDNSDDEESKNDITPDSTEPYTGSLLFKPGINQSSHLYYLDYTKIKGLDRDQKEELTRNIASSLVEEEILKGKLKELTQQAQQLASEPLNEEVVKSLESEESLLSELRDKVVDARKLKVNEKHKTKTKRHIQSMAIQWRRRKRLCMDFLINLEEVTDGGVSSKKCLSGDGPIVLDSDEVVAEAAIKFGKQKRKRVASAANSRKKMRGISGSLTLASTNKGAKRPTIMADENFVAVRLDSQHNVCRVYIDEDGNDDDDNYN